MAPSIRLDGLRMLVEAASIREVLLIADGRQWSALIKIGMSERRLVTQRGNVRCFAQLETALSLLYSLVLARV